MSIDASTPGEQYISSSTGVVAGAISSASCGVCATRERGRVTTRYGVGRTAGTDVFFTPPILKNKIADSPHWYVLRTTYGQEKKAYRYLSDHHVPAFFPTEKVYRVIHDKRRLVERSLLPNILFAYGTETLLKTFVYDNVNLPFLRFYYRYLHTGSQRQKEPLIVPEAQMSTFRIICQADSADIVVAQRSIPRFQRGELARVVEGKFAGVVGRVVRYKGQQRVGIVIDGLLTVATAYIPEAFLERVTDNV